MVVPDYGDPTPVSQQIAGDLRGQIRSGRIAVGGQLPSNKALAKQYGVAVETVRAAIRVLRDEGLVETHSTRGTFVLRVPGDPQPSAEFVQVMKRLDEMGEEVRQLRKRLDDLEGQ